MPYFDAVTTCAAVNTMAVVAAFENWIPARRQMKPSSS
jgi:hypothetical protein